jgi:putative inorganic carbon (hco3(-)) transporter
VFISSIPLIFVNPFNGVIAWYIFSLGNFNRVIWGFFADFNYGYIIAIVTCISWLISREKKSLPLTPLSVTTLLFMGWITITSFVAADSIFPGRAALVWSQWTYCLCAWSDMR